MITLAFYKIMLTEGRKMKKRGDQLVDCHSRQRSRHPNQDTAASLDRKQRVEGYLKRDKPLNLNMLGDGGTDAKNDPVTDIYNNRQLLVKAEMFMIFKLCTATWFR